MFLSLILISLSFIYATTVPATYKDLDDEMRSYVKYAAEYLGFSPGFFASHVTPTSVKASHSYYSTSWFSFHVITFDKEFIENQSVNVRKAIAAHEVGHAYYPCAILSQEHRYGHATYLEKENCADLISSIVYDYKYTLEALRALKKELPDSLYVSDRLKLLEYQLDGIEENDDEDLTYWDE